MAATRPPEARLRIASGFLYATAGGVVLLSAWAMAGGAPYLEVRLGLGPVTLVAGLALALLGFLTSRRSATALACAMAVVGLGTVVEAARAVNGQSGAPLWPVPLGLLVLLWTSGGFTAIRELSEQARP